MKSVVAALVHGVAAVVHAGIHVVVAALVHGGAYAEYCIAPLAQCLPVPRGLSDVEAAGLPETFFTVWSNVFDRGRLGLDGRGKETLLVHGGSSGIGVTAIQLVTAMGHDVIATVVIQKRPRLVKSWAPY